MFGISFQVASQVFAQWAQLTGNPMFNTMSDWLDQWAVQFMLMFSVTPLA